MKMTVRQAYATLGVAHGASEDESRAAYRRLALQFHPDKNPHAEATAKFQEISAAYKKICDFHKHGGNQRGSFFFDEEDDHDDDYHGFGDDDEDAFGFGGMDFDELEPTFEEMLMMFEMMFGGSAMPSVGKSKKTKNKNKNKKKMTGNTSVTSEPASAQAEASVDASVAAATAPPMSEPLPPKVAVPLSVGGKSRRRKAPLSKQRGRGPFGGLDDFMDPEMMLFEQFMGMSMNDPELNDMEGDLMEEMMHLFAGASDDDLFDLVGGGRGARKAKGAKAKGVKRPSRVQVETSDEDNVEEVSDWDDDGDGDDSEAKPAAVKNPGNQVEDQELNEPVAVNRRVQVHGKLLGTVKFVGAVHYAKGDFVGVELDEPEGKNDGTVKGVSYFTCRPRHGVMVRPQDVVAVPSPTASSSFT